jgi:lysophospholipase L1-like esterase
MPLRPLRLFLFLSLFAALCLSTAQAAPTVHKASTLPELKPLPLATGGRMRITPSPSPFGANDYTSQWPGSYFRAAFIGPTVYFRIGTSHEILHLLIDGRPLPPLVQPEPGAWQVEGLTNNRHEIDVFVATESQDSPDTFGGFAIPTHEKALPVSPRSRQIEFIGDSHTVGYGNLSPKHECPNGQVWSTTDNTAAFGPLVARHYDADYEINAISGRGVVRNYNGFAADTLPEAYPYVLFDKKQVVNEPAWKPQAIVIALGTNDFSTPLNTGERWSTREALHADYEATYLRFLADLRTRNPQAVIIVWATDMADGEIADEAGKVVRQRQQQGDLRVAFIEISGLNFGACDWHPSLADDGVIAEKLIHQIDRDSLWGNKHNQDGQ